MIRVTIEVIEDSRRCLVTVCADDIRRALEFVRGRYGWGKASVVFPLDPEIFLVKEGAIEVGLEEAGTPGDPLTEDALLGPAVGASGA